MKFFVRRGKDSNYTEKIPYNMLIKVGPIRFKTVSDETSNELFSEFSESL